MESKPYKHRFFIEYNADSATTLNYSQYTAASVSRLREPSSFDPDFPRLGTELSFEQGLTTPQKSAVNITLAGIGIALICAPILTLIIMAWCLLGLFSVLVFWRGLLIFVAVCSRITLRHAASPAPNKTSLPIYTILVPLYREAALLPQIAAALAELDWPRDRLDIQILLETDDAETIAAAQAAPFARNTRLILIPPGGPRTKPNALNVGLTHAMGEFVTVFDAEDIPHPTQLKAAYHAFSRGSSDLACVQAPLIGRDQRGGWLAAQWALEYAVQFGLLLPSMAVYQMPLLIGGTSNHFRKSALQALGGWDSYNVTEDADLGMRIARARLKCAMIAPPTLEDAPTRLSVWLAQRSRWIKGYLQTWLVLMRAPRKTMRQMGGLPFWLMQLSLGGAIIAPVFHLPTIMLLAPTWLLTDLGLGQWGAALLFSALAINAFADISAPGRKNWRRFAAALTRPVYWPLHSLAAYRALWELAKSPFFWAKTPHQPCDHEETTNCSTGLSASAWPSPSSRSAYLPRANSVQFESPISARTNGRGDSS